MKNRNQTLRTSPTTGLTTEGKMAFATWFAYRPELTQMTQGQQDWLFFECLDNSADQPTLPDQFGLDALECAKATFASYVDTTDFSNIPGA